MKVKCVDAGTGKYLTHGKIYEVRENRSMSYVLTSDDTGNNTNCHSKSRFEIVKEPSKIKVKCIKNDEYESLLKLNKVYEVIKETSALFYLNDESNEKFGYYKNRFQIIEETEMNSTFNMELFKSELAKSKNICSAAQKEVLAALEAGITGKVVIQPKAKAGQIWKINDQVFMLFENDHYDEYRFRYVTLANGSKMGGNKNEFFHSAQTSQKFLANSLKEYIDNGGKL